MTLPSNLYELPTLAEALAIEEITPEVSYSCPSCPRVVAAEGMVSTTDLPGDLPDYICHTCASIPFREGLAAQEIANAPAPSWASDCEIGNRYRAERAMLLAQCDYRAAPDYPMSETLREEWLAYRQALRDITTVYASPDLVVWPTKPT